METQRVVVKSKVGRNAGHKLFFILAVLCITGVSAFAVTDVLFLVDSTGSMDGLINFQAAFNDIITAIETDSCPETIMYAVSDHRNYTDGENYSAYGVNLVQPFTSSVQDVRSAIDGLTAGGGVDLPESQLKAMVSIADNWLTSSGDLGFNGRPGAQRILIWAGDAPGHIATDESGSSGSPPTGYYPTLDAVIDALTAQGITVFALNSLDNTHGLNEPYDGISNQAPPERQQASEITDATGGMLFNGVNSATSAIKNAIIDEIICFTFEKDDDLDDENPSDCRQDGQEIVYTISWTNTSGQALTNAWILDRLPQGVTYPVEYTFDPNTWEMIPLDPNYDPENHEHVWFIGPIPADASGSVSLTVVVNSNAVPGMNLINTAELYDGESLVTIATKKTLICCPENPISTIYVDKFAMGANSGLNWENAYNSLDDALTQARESVCVTNFTILVAQGTYAPINATNGFVLPSGCSVFGGYPTGGGDVASPKKYETVLTGLIDEETISATGVTMGNDTILDGFTIANAFDYNIYGSGVDFTVSHCTITECLFGYGISAFNGNVTVQWCNIRSNGTDGLYHEGEEFTLTVDNSHSMRNGEYGIRTIGSTLALKNSIVSESDMTKKGREGIYIENPTYQPKIFNATIANNKAQGIHFEDDADASGDPNNLDYPDLQNSIVFFNNGGGSQLSGINPDLHANFCCIEDCNNVPGTTNFSNEPEFAYTVDPNGMPDPNNYHLSATSVCIDRANPDPAMGYELQVDYDNEIRQYGGAVDVGADEVYNCNDEYLSQADVFNALDFDADGIVGLTELAMFSKSWMTFDPNHPYCDPNNPNYVSDPNAPGYIDEDDKLRFNPICDLDEDLHVGLSDLILFLDDWTWIACWKLDEINASMMAMQSQSQSQSMMTESMTVENTEAMMVFAENSGVAATESSEVDGQAAVEEPPVVEEKSVAEQIADLQDSIEFLEQLWNQEPDIQQDIGADEWQEFMNSVRNSLLDLQTENVQIE
jgi:uncharacterized repeat protein (TIGR01451 family)